MKYDGYGNHLQYHNVTGVFPSQSTRGPVFLWTPLVKWSSKLLTFFLMGKLKMAGLPQFSTPKKKTSALRNKPPACSVRFLESSKVRTWNSLAFLLNVHLPIVSWRYSAAQHVGTHEKKHSRFSWVSPFRWDELPFWDNAKSIQIRCSWVKPIFPVSKPPFWCPCILENVATLRLVFDPNAKSSTVFSYVSFIVYIWNWFDVGAPFNPVEE